MSARVDSVSAAAFRQEKFIIGIATRGTNPNLQRLLDRLRFQIKFGEYSNGRIVVAVNASSLTVNCKFKPEDCVAFHPTPGYATIRNAILSHRQSGEGIFFIDDDELPDRNWIEQHLTIERRFPKSVFVGPIRSLDETSLLPICDARMIRSHRLGKRLKWATTGNMYFPNSVLEANNVYFDEFFNDGGEDTDCAFRLRRAGTKIRWNPNAVVDELTPEFRRTIDWKMNREIKALAVYAVAGRRNFGFSWALIHFCLLTGSVIKQYLGTVLRHNESPTRLKIAISTIKSLLSGRVSS